MNKGRVAQAGGPADILLRPADDFVRGFLGREDLPLRLLDLRTVAEVARPVSGGPGARIAAGATLRQALTRMLGEHCARLLVENARGEIIGEIDVNDIVAAHHDP